MTATRHNHEHYKSMTIHLAPKGNLNYNRKFINICYESTMAFKIFNGDF